MQALQVHRLTMERILRKEKDRHKGNIRVRNIYAMDTEQMIARNER